MEKVQWAIFIIDATLLSLISFLLFRSFKIDLLKQEGNENRNLLLVIILSHIGLIVISFLDKKNNFTFKWKIVWRVIQSLLTNILGFLAGWDLFVILISSFYYLSILLEMLNKLKQIMSPNKGEQIEKLEQKLNETGQGINLQEIEQNE